MVSLRVMWILLEIDGFQVPPAGQPTSRCHHDGTNRLKKGMLGGEKGVEEGFCPAVE